MTEEKYELINLGCSGCGVIRFRGKGYIRVGYKIYSAEEITDNTLFIVLKNRNVDMVFDDHCINLFGKFDTIDDKIVFLEKEMSEPEEYDIQWRYPTEFNKNVVVIMDHDHPKPTIVYWEYIDKQ